MSKKYVQATKRVDYQLGEYNNIRGKLMSTSRRKDVTLFECTLWDTRNIPMDRKTLNVVADGIKGKLLEFDGAIATCFDAYVYTGKVLGSDGTWMELRGKFKMDANEHTRSISSEYHHKSLSIEFDTVDGEVMMEWSK